MTFFTASEAKEDLEQSVVSAHLSKSGYYLINIIAPFVSSSRNGSTSVDLFLEHSGKKQVLYGNMRLTNNDGSKNQIGNKIFNQLVVIAGISSVSEPVDAELPIGKKGAATDVGVLEDLTDVDVILRMQMDYSVYNGSIQEKKIIRGFFRAEDNASAEEIVNKTEAGVQYNKDQEFSSTTSFNDGLTEEEVNTWIKNNRPKGTAGGGSSAPVKKPTFGKKKTFGS